MATQAYVFVYATPGKVEEAGEGHRREPRG
jgi:hypothetical protein